MLYLNLFKEDPEEENSIFRPANLRHFQVGRGTRLDSSGVR